MSNIENLKDVYRDLYNANAEAAEEDYLEYFEREYSPEKLDECTTEEEVKSMIAYLAEEVLNDTGDEDLTREWLINAGADDELVARCGFESNEEDGEYDA